jgi:hypothetical protein
MDPLDQAIEKTEDRKIRGRKMNRDSTTKDSARPVAATNDNRERREPDES